MSTFGGFELLRYPETNDQNLQAWDAADRYILAHLSEKILVPFTGQTVICNDEFGALVTALHEQAPVAWNDSALAHEAIRRNFERNNLTQNWSPMPSTETPEVADAPVSAVILKIPKSLTFLEDQLARLAPVISSDTVVIGAAKAKHIHTSTLKLFEKYIGPTTTSLAKQKARLIFSTPEQTTSPKNPWPQSFDYAGRRVLGHAGVFAHRKLDQGTRFLLDQMDTTSWAQDASTVVDLGCGNGVLGLKSIRQNGDVVCTFVDRSYMAIASAQTNVQRWFPGANQHRFVLADALTSIADPSQLAVPEASVDLVLCNPPFHDNYVMGEQTATKMFTQAASVLTPNGRLVVVANRHLRYLPILKRLFRTAKVAASNRKFVVLVAQGVNA